MRSIQIIVGSEMGTAEMVADSIKETLAPLEYKISINLQAQAEHLLNHPEDILLICTSNTGAGDLPDSIQPLYHELTTSFPKLAGRRYGLINLGDSSYMTFAEAGLHIDVAMSEVGAVRIGEPLVLDATSGLDPCEEAQAWVKQWVTQL